MSSKNHFTPPRVRESGSTLLHVHLTKERKLGFLQLFCAGAVAYLSFLQSQDSSR
jgi:hypothetical protein